MALHSMEAGIHMHDIHDAQHDRTYALHGEAVPGRNVTRLNFLAYKNMLGIVPGTRSECERIHAEQRLAEQGACDTGNCV